MTMLAVISGHSNTHKFSVASVDEALGLARDYGATVDRLVVYASDDEWSEEPPVATYTRATGRLAHAYGRAEFSWLRS